MECPAYYINNHLYVQMPGCRAKEFSRCYNMGDEIAKPIWLRILQTVECEDGTIFLLCTPLHEGGLFIGLYSSGYVDGRWKKDPDGGEPSRVG